MFEEEPERRIGLCWTCSHRSTIVSNRGSVFYLCDRSRTDPNYPKYPRLPVIACAGWDRIDAERHPHSPADLDGEP
jgi:hypothetical protein